MFEPQSREVAHFGDRGSAAETFIFLGGAWVFPESIMRIVEQEAGDAHALRLDSLRDLRTLAAKRNNRVRKVFFDDKLAAEVFRDIDHHRADFPDADWVLAYREPAVARRLLDERGQSPRLARILLLPMTLPICPWSSLLRLVLAGQFIAAGDLIDPTYQAQALRPAARDDARLQMHSAIPADQAMPVTRGAANPGLTQREKEVLALVSQGGRNKSIAHTMSLSEHTVKLHLHNAITKIGARNRTEAATWYLSHHPGD